MDNQTTGLIDDHVSKGTAEDQFSHGFNFGIIPILFGFTLMGIGIVMIFSLHVIAIAIGIAVFFAGAMLSTSKSGVEIDYTNDLYREYSTFLFFKIGKWKSMNYFPYITVLKANKANKASDITGLNRTVEVKEQLGVYFLNGTHRKKILVKRTGKDMAKSKKEAALLAEKTGKEIVRFNPKTVSRRRAR
jgi:hypothetical protein